MDKIIVGIETNIPYDFQGKKGVTNRFYLTDDEDQSFSRDNGSAFVGRHVEFIKVPKDINISEFGLGDLIRPYYNRYGQIVDIIKL